MTSNYQIKKLPDQISITGRGQINSPINIWHLYIVVLLVSLIILVISSGFFWKSVVKHEKSELTHANRVVKASLSSLLNLNESLLKITGERLLDSGIMNDDDALQELLINIQKSNPAFACTKIINPQGKMITSSCNIDGSLGMLESEITADSFKQSLISDRFVLGRTYYMAETNDWMIPVQLRITNHKKHVIAVLETDIRLSNYKIPWNNNELNQYLKDGFELSIVRNDGYFQYYSPVSEMKPESLYNNKIESGYMQTFNEKLLNQTGSTLDEMRQQPDGIFSLIYPRHPSGESIAAVSYDDQSGLYIFTKKNISNLYQQLVTPISWMVLILTIFNISLFWLFRFYHRLQIDTRSDLEHMATHDPLTGLPNLRHLLSNFHEIKKQFGTAFSVFFIDMDDFKNINDVYGHSMGDQILKIVSEIIQNYFTNSFYARMGGDEFVVISAINEHPKKLCDRFLYKLKQPITVGSVDFSLRASIGIATYKVDGETLEDLLRKSDIAMYQAKKSRIGIRLYSRDLEIQNERIEIIGRELNHALENNQISLMFQPQVEYPGNKIIGMESLIRWESPELGVVTPEEFILIAESTGAILDIGTYIFEQALINCQDLLSKLSAEGCNIFNTNNKLRLSINVSIRQLASHNYVSQILDLINTYKNEKTTITIEITETINIDKIHEINENIALIRSTGTHISLDDFGTGYSSLSHLVHMKVDEIKIDKDFVKEINNDETLKNITKSIIEMGRNLNVRVTAEGVENEKQLKVLSENGCKTFQGYYFYPPMEKEDLLKLIISNFHLEQQSALIQQ